jgi:hypothetical protein
MRKDRAMKRTVDFQTSPDYSQERVVEEEHSSVWSWC